MQLSFVGTLIRQESSIGWHSIILVPEKFAMELEKQDHLRVKAIFNRTETAHISIKKRQGEFYIVVNNKIRKALKIADNHRVEVNLETDKSKYGMPMPQELELMLAEEETASEFFENLTPGKQRSLIHIVSTVKNTDSRIRKAQAIVEHLIEVQGALDFKGVHAKIKEVNQRFKIQ